MISASGTLRERVERLIKARAKPKGGPERAVCTWVAAPGPVIVRETEQTGEAMVVLTVPEGCECIDLFLTTGLFGILRQDKNADGAVLVILPDGAIEAHVIECKRTVFQDDWEEACKQMTWTLTKLQALAGALGERISGAVCYTAYREDRLSEDESPNPAYPERIIGIPESDAEADLSWGRRKQLEWMRGRVRLRGFDEAFVHHRIPLDRATGRGAAALAPRAR